MEEAYLIQLKIEKEKSKRTAIMWVGIISILTMWTVISPMIGIVAIKYILEDD